MAAGQRLHRGRPTLGTGAAEVMCLLWLLHAGTPVWVLLHVLIVARMGARGRSSAMHR